MMISVSIVVEQVRKHYMLTYRIQKSGKASPHLSIIAVQPTVAVKSKYKFSCSRITNTKHLKGFLSPLMV